MQGRRGHRLMVATALVVALVASACGGSSDSGDGGDRSPVSDAVATTGGSATVLQAIDATSLDPTTVINGPSQGSAPISALYDGLFTVDQQTGAVEPRIATDFSSADGLTWTMTLRPDVMFSDGTPLNAAAVEAQWTRIAGNIRASASSYMKDVVSMRVVDDLTFEVVLGTVNRQFHQIVPWSSLTWIPSPTAMAAEGEDFGNQPVGAGPFVLKSRIPSSETVLEKNPNYWQAGLPKLDTLVIKTVQDPQQSYDTLTTGGAVASVNVPDIYEAQAKSAGYTTIGVDQIGGAGWLFGSSRAPFDDIRARKAIYLAADMNALNDTVSGGEATVPDSLFPEGTPFHDADIPFPSPDPVEAQRLLDELAAEGTPLSFTIIHPGGDAGNKAVALQTQLSRYDNLDVDVRQLDGSTYGVTLFTGDFDLAIYGVGGLDPEPVLASMRSTHPIKIASMDSPEIDRLVQQGREATDLAGRKAAYDQIAADINDLYKLIWMNVNHSWAVEAPNAAGLSLYGTGTPFFENFGLVG